MTSGNPSESHALNTSCQSGAGGCDEFQGLSRRGFLGRVGQIGLGLAAANTLPGWLPRVAYADSHEGSRDVLVVLFLRGGADGLSLCVPFGEPAYRRLRPSLSLGAPDDRGAGATIDLDGFFGLAPSMAPLHELYSAGDLSIVHACGSTHPTRSHFDAMHFMEAGVPRADMETGWLGRHLASVPALVSGTPLQALSIGFGLPRSLVGAPSALALGEDPTTYGLRGEALRAPDRLAAIEQLYEAADASISRSAIGTLRTLELLDQLDLAGYRTAGEAQYPESPLGVALRSSAALIKADVGVEAVALDAGGWDTHDDQGPIDGTMAGLMSGLAEALRAFWARSRCVESA